MTHKPKRMTVVDALRLDKRINITNEENHTTLQMSTDSYLVYHSQSQRVIYFGYHESEAVQALIEGQ